MAGLRSSVVVTDGSPGRRVCCVHSGGSCSGRSEVPPTLCRAQEPWSPVVPDRVRRGNVATRTSWAGAFAAAACRAAWVRAGHGYDVDAERVLCGGARAARRGAAPVALGTWLADPSGHGGHRMAAPARGGADEGFVRPGRRAYRHRDPTGRALARPA